MCELSPLNSKVVLFLVSNTLTNYSVKHLLQNLKTEVNLLNKISQKDSNLECSEFLCQLHPANISKLTIKSSLFNVYYPFFTCVLILSVNICLTVMILIDAKQKLSTYIKGEEAECMNARTGFLIHSAHLLPSFHDTRSVSSYCLSCQVL